MTGYERNMRGPNYENEGEFPSIIYSLSLILPYFEGNGFGAVIDSVCSGGRGVSSEGEGNGRWTGRQEGERAGNGKPGRGIWSEYMCSTAIWRNRKMLEI